MRLLVTAAILVLIVFAEPISSDAVAQIVSANDTRYDTSSDYVLEVMLGGEVSIERDRLTDDQTSKIPGVIIAGPKLMSFVKARGPDIVFFTSRARPLGRLAEITNTESEFASWAIPALFDMKALLILEYLIGGEPRNPHIIGNLNFPKLFFTHPELRLFVTSANIRLVDTIEREGGGMKIRFVERTVQSR